MFRNRVPGTCFGNALWDGVTGSSFETVTLSQDRVADSSGTVFRESVAKRRLSTFGKDQFGMVSIRF